MEIKLQELAALNTACMVYTATKRIRLRALADVGSTAALPVSYMFVHTMT